MRKERERAIATPEEIAQKNALFVKVAESSFRIALASFGGALVGISLARRNPVPLLQNQSIAKHSWVRTSPALEVPTRWAWSCAFFALIFEGTQWLSPTSKITENRYLQTVGDFTLGGAVAGLILRGMPVHRNRGSGAVAAPRLVGGFLSGLALGFIPGVIVAGISLLDDTLQDSESVHEDLIVEESTQAPDPRALNNDTSSEKSLLELETKPLTQIESIRTERS